MTLQAADRVKVQWSGSGTGTMTLGSAVTTEGGFQTIPASLDGQIVSYSIKHTTAQEAEAGFGTYTASGPTLTRTFRTYPTFGGSAVSFSAGTKEVSIAPLAINLAPNLATTDPNPAVDDITAGYLQGWSRWLNTSTATLWFCVNHSAGAAVWKQIEAAAGTVADGAITAAKLADGAAQGNKRYGNIQTAPAPVDSISTVTLAADVDLVILDLEAIELRIVTPAGRRNIDVLNDSGGTIDVADGTGNVILADLEDRHLARLAWDGAAWIDKSELTAEGHAHPSSAITDSTAAGRSLLTAADAAAQRALLGVPTAFDPVETTLTAITVSDSFADQDLISTATGAVTVTLGNATSDNKFGAITEGAQEITVQVAADVQYYLETDNKTASGRTASFKIRGWMSWMVFRIDAGNRRYLIKGGTDHEQNLRNQVVSGIRTKKYTGLTGAQTLSGANFLAGATLIKTSTAATWTVPSRVGTANTGYSEHLVIHNRGSGAITLSASGVTIKGATSVAVDASATIEWEADGTTEYAWIRSS